DYNRVDGLEAQCDRTVEPVCHRPAEAARCGAGEKAGRGVWGAGNPFSEFPSRRSQKTGTGGTAVFNLDAPEQMDTGANIGQVSTRVLHYHYDCDKNYRNCADEEQFYLGKGYGLWQWKHYKRGNLVKTSVMNNLEKGRAAGKL